jgi:hypothetical protein
MEQHERGQKEPTMPSSFYVIRREGPKGIVLGVRPGKLSIHAWTSGPWTGSSHILTMSCMTSSIARDTAVIDMTLRAMHASVEQGVGGRVVSKVGG